MTRALLSSLLSLFAATSLARAAPPPAPDPLHRVYRLPSGIVLPYPLDNLFRGWVSCGRRAHHALDLGGVGPDAGLGTPVRAMGPGVIVALGDADDEPDRFGEPLTDSDTTIRGHQTLPTSGELPNYGKVFFFTKDYGRHRMGTFVSLRVDAGPLKDHLVRYLHLAAYRPGLTVGSRVAAGDELGLMGGTAVLESSPHLHLDITPAHGKPIDIGKLFGIGSTRVSCGAASTVVAATRARYQRAAKKLMHELRTAPTPPALPACGEARLEGDFGNNDRQVQHIPLPEGAPGERITVTLTRLDDGAWSPRLLVEDAFGTTLYSGTRLTAKARRRLKIHEFTSGSSGEASLTFERPRGDALTLATTAWTTTSRQRKNARWRLTITRPPCPAP